MTEHPKMREVRLSLEMLYFPVVLDGEEMTAYFVEGRTVIFEQPNKKDAEVLPPRPSHFAPSPYVSCLDCGFVVHMLNTSHLEMTAPHQFRLVPTGSCTDCNPRLPLVIELWKKSNMADPVDVVGWTIDNRPISYFDKELSLNPEVEDKTQAWVDIHLLGVRWMFKKPREYKVPDRDEKVYGLKLAWQPWLHRGRKLWSADGEESPEAEDEND